MTAVLKILGLVSGEPSPFDEQFLQEYDPERDGVNPTDGRPMFAHIVTTPDLANAKRYPDKAAAMEDYRRVCQRDPHGGRKTQDGRPNRPLTAFTAQAMDAGDDVKLRDLDDSELAAIQRIASERRDPDASPICDFCSSPEVRWSYNATDFGHSKGGWAACDACSGLIEAGRWQALARRSAESFVAKYRAEVGMNVSLDEQVPEFRRLHAGFREHRWGERERYEPGDDRPADTTAAPRLTLNGRIYVLDGGNRQR
jgi:hypothetical protein